MDLSKLPKLSKTGAAQPSDQADAPPPAPSTPQSQNPIPIGYAIAARPAIGADAWFNTIIGLLCLFLGRMFGSYLIARALGHPFHTGVEWQTGDNAGQEVAYPDLEGHQMLIDAGIFLFGLAVLLEVVVKAFIGLQFRVPRAAVGTVLILAIATTAANCIASFKLMSDGTVPLMSGLAAAFGGYIVFDAWRILADSRLLASAAEFSRLIKCPDCGHEVSKGAARCPQCGRAFTQWYYWPIGLLFILFLLAIVMFLRAR